MRRVYTLTTVPPAVDIATIALVARSARVPSCVCRLRARAHYPGPWTVAQEGLGETVSDVCIATDDMSVATALKSLKDEWSFSVATDRRSAESLIEAGSFDVMLLDRRSDWVDDSLLVRLRDAHPEAVSVALVPDFAVADAVRSSRLAHQVMSADATPETVANACERAILVRGIVSHPGVLEVVAATPELAAPPEMWTTLSRVLEDPNSGAAEVADVVASDPAIAAQVLRLANSAFFGLSRHVTQLRDAISLIGFTTIRALVLQAASMRDTLPAQYPLDRTGIQKHALSTAQVARSIAGTSRAADSFLAGLLMDVGIIVIATAKPDAYAGVIAEAAATGEPLYVVEERNLGFTHAAVGATLLGLWGMPYSVIDAVAHHHAAPNLTGDLSVREALFLARDANQTLGVPDPYDAAGSLLSVEQLEHDMTLELLVHSARSAATEVDATQF